MLSAVLIHRCAAPAVRSQCKSVALCLLRCRCDCLSPSVPAVGVKATNQQSDPLAISPVIARVAQASSAFSAGSLSRWLELITQLNTDAASFESLPLSSELPGLCSLQRGWQTSINLSEGCHVTLFWSKKKKCNEKNPKDPQRAM